MYTALTIAGSDSSGGAGIQADIKTMTANGVYAMSAIAALTAQNTTGVQDVMSVTPEFLSEELDSVFTDIFPDAVKTGMIPNAGLIDAAASSLKKYRARHIVVDPVMVATSGSRLIAEEAIGTLKEKLLPLAEVVTPNIPEAEILSGRTIRSKEDMESAAKAIFEACGCAVLCKGGHSINDANDVLYDGKECRWFGAERISNPNTHGTGCTLSSAIASNLAKGAKTAEAVLRAKQYLTEALSAMLDLGHGSGPLDHIFEIQEKCDFGH
jgi:hydroxymethylpyrimidine/phosphomethylpyrimidine kinase